jgi:diguanylate cyclase (GGDEF)-like protein/PAS domain S-box-containing protein
MGLSGMLNVADDYKSSIVVAVIILASIPFYFIARINYLFFHSFTEVFALVVAVLIYIIAGRTFKYSKNNYLMFLGYIYFFVAIIDFFHLLTYKGMGVFPGFDANVPTQLWIAGRYVNAFSLLLATFLIRRRISRRLIIWAYSFIIILLLASILWLDVFPVCYIEGQGLTRFKVISEYIISLVFLVAIVKTYFERDYINQVLFKIMIASMAVTILSEMSFTLYTDVYGVMNFIGHIFKVIAYCLVYWGIFLYGIDAPYEMVFKELSEREKNLVSTQQKLLNIIEFLPDATFVVDADKKVISWNRAIEEMTGLKKEDILGKGDSMYSVPFYGEKRLMLVDYLFLDDQKAYLEFEKQYDLVERKGNTLFAESFRPSIFGGKGAYIWAKASPLFDSEGTIVGAIESVRDITKRKQAEEKLKALSTLDGLTGLVNRRHFEEYFDREWKRSVRTGKPLSLVMCDIDYFKYYNDTYGHLQGDECLRKVAGALQKAVNRAGDLVARFGGEEFIVVLPETDPEGVVKVAEMLREKVESLKIEHKKSPVSSYLTISLGVATAVPSREDAARELISSADMALYQAKKEGRNRVSFINL